MRRRFVVVAVIAGLVALTASAFAVGGPRGLIWDDGHYAKPGTVDDGKDLLAQTSIPLASAVAIARGAADGALGQVDLEHFRGRLVYMVDIGNREVRIDAANGKVVAISPRD